MPPCDALPPDIVRPGKSVILGQNGTRALTPAFSDELYEYSRKRYLEIN